MKEYSYRAVPEKDLLSRGRFLSKHYLSMDEMRLGLAYLRAAAGRGNIEAASAVIDTCERECLSIPHYDVIVKETAYDAIGCCEYADEGISFLETLVIYASKAEFMSALEILKHKEISHDASVIRTRMLIAEYAVTNRDPEEMLAACRENLDCYTIYRFYQSFFSPWPKNSAHFDHIMPQDAEILLSSYAKRNEDPAPLLEMIKASKSPHRFWILENYERERRMAEERSKHLRDLFEKETDDMHLSFLIRDLILDFSGSFDEEEEEE